MTRREFIHWQAYTEQFGPLDPIRKFDTPAARIATTVNRTWGGKAELDNFLPYPKPLINNLSEVDEQVFRAFGVRR